MSNLARAKAVALEQLAVQDETGSDAATDPDDRHVVGSPIRSEDVLGKRRSLAVVGDIDGQLVALADEAAERQVLPVEADRPADGSGDRVDDPGRADADAHQRGVVCLDEFVHQPMYEFDRLVAVAAIERDPGRPAELAPEVDDLAAKFAFAEVDADQVARVIGDAQENWRAD